MTKKSLIQLAVLITVLVLAALSTGCHALIPHDGAYNRTTRNMPGYKYNKVCDQNNLGGEKTCVEEENIEPGAMYGYGGYGYGYGYGYGGNMALPGGGGRPQAFNPPKIDCYVNDSGQQCCVGPGQMCYGSEGDAFDPASSPNYRLQRRVDSIGRQVNNINRHEVAQDECIRSGNCVQRRSGKGRKQ